MASVVLLLALLGACGAGSGSLPADWEAQLITARESVWRDWFAGGAQLAGTLTDDFVGIGFGAGPWDTKETTMAGAREFAASGSKLVSLEFPKTTTQRYGEVVVVYSDYALVSADGAGVETSQHGRATEVFVWREGRWVHPGWHLDSGQ